MALRSPTRAYQVSSAAIASGLQTQLYRVLSVPHNNGWPKSTMGHGHQNFSTQRPTLRATSPPYFTVSETDGYAQANKRPRFSQENEGFRTRLYPLLFIPHQKPQDTTLNSTEKEGSPRFSVQARSTAQHRLGIPRRRETFLRFFTRSPLCLASTAQLGHNGLLSKPIRTGIERTFPEAPLLDYSRTPAMDGEKHAECLQVPDPNYREKLELLLKTLRSLAASELLFFLDEWGPVQVRKARRQNV